MEIQLNASLSSEGWNEEIHDALARSLHQNPRPVLVANPDLVADKRRA